ncbi:Uncharacterised protein [Mycobacterium tuberculosis]|nr:Uncharacterised protein [Mycobacterium tuberculosis]
MVRLPINCSDTLFEASPCRIRPIMTVAKRSIILFAPVSL